MPKSEIQTDQNPAKGEKVKFIPNDIPKTNLTVLGEGVFPYLGSGPTEAIRISVSLNSGMNSGVLSTWNSMQEKLQMPLNGEVHFTITDIREVRPNEEYNVYLKFFLRPNLGTK